MFDYLRDCKCVVFLIGFITYSLTCKCQGIAYTKEQLVIDTNYSINLRDEVRLIGSFIAPSNALPILIIVSPPLTPDRDLPTNSTPGGMVKYLALQIARFGYGVFWFDNRGMGKSEGTADSATLYSHAADVQEIFGAIKKQNPNSKVGLLGLSEGGAASEVVVSQNTNIAFLILLSVQGLSGYDFSKYQTKNMFDQKGQLFNQKQLIDSMYREYDLLSQDLYAILEKHDDVDTIKHLFRERILGNEDSTPSRVSHYQRQVKIGILEAWSTPQQLVLRKFKPSQFLSKVRCPLLVVCGDRDEQVDCDRNLEQIKTVVTRSNHPNASFVKLEGVNHQYQTLKPGSWEAVDRNETFSQAGLDAITSWLLKIR